MNDAARAWTLQIREMAHGTRRALEPGLRKDGQGRVMAAGVCLHASVLMAALFEKFGMGSAVVRGGSGDDGEGAVDADGKQHGHYWVELQGCGVTVVVDITGDQFGHEAVRVMTAAEGAKLLCAGGQNVVDQAVAELRRELGLA